MGPTPEQAPVTPHPTPAIKTAIPPPKPTTIPLTPEPTPTTAPVTPAPEPTMTPDPTTTLVITVAETPADIPDYKRSDWKHWVDTDGDCQDARQEVLIAEILEPVEYETD